MNKKIPKYVIIFSLGFLFACAILLLALSCAVSKDALPLPPFTMALLACILTPLCASSSFGWFIVGFLLSGSFGYTTILWRLHEDGLDKVTALLSLSSSVCLLIFFCFGYWFVFYSSFFPKLLRGIY